MLKLINCAIYVTKNVSHEINVTQYASFSKKWKEEHGNPSVRDKLEIKAMKKEIVKEVENQLVQLEKTRPPQEAELSAEIPAIGKFYLKFKNCCTIS